LFNAQPLPAFWVKPVFDNVTNEIAEFEYVYCNQKMYDYLGLTPEQLIGKQITNSPTVANDTFKKEFFQQILHVFKTGEEIQGKFYNSVFNKYYSYIRVRVQDGVLTVLQDRTFEYKMLEQLEQQKNLLDNILKCSPSGITVSEAIRDNENNIVDWRSIIVNNAIEQLLGFSEAELLSEPYSKLIPQLITGTVAEEAILTLTTGKPFIVQYYYERLNKWLEFSAAKMDDYHLINIFTDITATKQTQLQLEKSIEALQRSNTNLEEFAYAASHDLKEPIRKVRTFGDRLKQKLSSRMNEDEVEMFERLEKASARMELLVEDLLAFSHVSERPREFEIIDLDEKIKRVLEDLEMEIEEKHAEINIGPLPTLKAHRRQIQQLFQNLISNSLKYSKPNIPPVINITSKEVLGSETGINIIDEEKNKKFYLIEVSDNGIGFEQQYAERIFQMFQRLHGKQEYSGTGVGLSIARKVVENHQGFIIAEGEPGKGATFKVYLPA